MIKIELIMIDMEMNLQDNLITNKTFKAFIFNKILIQRFYFNFRTFLDSFFKELILTILEIFKQTLLKMFLTSKEEDKTINNIKINSKRY